MGNVQICIPEFNVRYTTAVCYINNMGGSKSPDCNLVARQIWEYCVERNIWISASHLSGCENTEADRESRQFNDRTEWQLESDIYHSITKQFGHPSIDLFASRLNKQCPVMPHGGLIQMHCLLMPSLPM